MESYEIVVDYCNHHYVVVVGCKLPEVYLTVFDQEPDDLKVAGLCCQMEAVTFG